MTSTLRALTFGLAMVAATAVAAPPQPAQTRLALFTRELRFTLPAGFVEATNRSNDTHVLIEYVPKGETVANWRRMVTVQAYRGLGSSPATSAAIARQAFYPAACRIGPIYRDGGEQALGGGLRRSLIVNGCASLPAGAYPKALAGAGEQDFIAMFRDGETVWTLNYAERGAPFPVRKPPRPVAQAQAVMQQIFGAVSLTPR